MMNSKKFFTLVSPILITIFFSSFDTSVKLDFTTEVVQIPDNRIEIEVTILSGEPEFIYSLWDNVPWENGNEIENSGMVTSTAYMFRNLSRKPYYVMVSDKNGLRRVKQIEIPGTSFLSARQFGN